MKARKSVKHLLASKCYKLAYFSFRCPEKQISYPPTPTATELYNDKIFLMTPCNIKGSFDAKLKFAFNLRLKSRSDFDKPSNFFSNLQSVDIFHFW